MVYFEKSWSPSSPSRWPSVTRMRQVRNEKGPSNGEDVTANQGFKSKVMVKVLHKS